MPDCCPNGSVAGARQCAAGEVFQLTLALAGAHREEMEKGAQPDTRRQDAAAGPPARPPPQDELPELGRGAAMTRHLGRKFDIYGSSLQEQVGGAGKCTRPWRWEARRRRLPAASQSPPHRHPHPPAPIQAYIDLLMDTVEDIRRKYTVLAFSEQLVGGCLSVARIALTLRSLPCNAHCTCLLRRACPGSRSMQRHLVAACTPSPTTAPAPMFCRSAQRGACSNAPTHPPTH